MYKRDTTVSVYGIFRQFDDLISTALHRIQMLKVSLIGPFKAMFTNHNAWKKLIFDLLHIADHCDATNEY